MYVLCIIYVYVMHIAHSVKLFTNNHYILTLLPYTIQYTTLIAMPVPASLLKLLLVGLDGTVNDAKERLSYWYLSIL